MKCLRRRPIDGSACKGADKTGSQEDGKDAEVLGGVGYGDMFVTCSEGVLDERTEVVWQWHVLGRCASAGDDNEGATVGVSRDFYATCGRGECNMPITRLIWKGISAQRVGHPKPSYV